MVRCKASNSALQLDTKVIKWYLLKVEGKLGYYTRAKVAKLAYAQDLGSCGATRGGSTPPFRTKINSEKEKQGEMAETELKVEVTSSGPCERMMSVIVLPELVRSQRAKVIDELRKEITLKGYRPGKVPRDLIAKRFADSIKEELKQHVVTETFRKAVEQEKITPVSAPIVEDLKLEEDDGLSYKARFDVMPEIDLARYTGFWLEKKVHKVTDEDVDKGVANLREQYAHFVPKGGAAEKGDYLLIDFRLLDEEGKVTPDTERANQLVMAGMDDPMALFSRELVGKSEGNGQIIVIDFPADYPEKNLQGRKVTYQVDVKGARQKVLPELDDHFARQASDAQDLAGLKDIIRRNMEREITHQADRQAEDEIFRLIIEANPFNVPNSMVESAVKRQLESYKKRNQPVDEERLAQIMQPSAEFMIKREFIIREVASKEQIAVEEEDIISKMQQYADQLGSSIEEVRKDFRSREGMNYLHSVVQEDKVIKYLLENNDIELVEE